MPFFAPIAEVELPVRWLRPAIPVATIVTPRYGKAVGKDAALQILAKGLADIRLWRVVVALAVELPRAGQLKPSLEVTALS